MTLSDLHKLRSALRGLSLHEVDFSVGDAFVSRLRDVKVAIDELDTPEPRLAEWLSAEHTKAGILWSAAKMNWAKERSSGTDSIFNVRAREALVDRFNAWVSTFEERLNTYEAAGHTVEVVVPWIVELERFRQDPVQNP